MRSYSELMTRKAAEYGTKFDASNLDPRFVSYFENGQRIKVETLGTTITGTVGVTGGWRPCFLLMRTSRSMSSSWTLGENDKIVAVKRGGKYVPAYQYA